MNEGWVVVDDGNILHMSVLDRFWPVTVYDAQGYLQANPIRQWPPRSQTGRMVLISIPLSEQVWQLGDVARYAPSLILGQHPGDVWSLLRRSTRFLGHDRSSGF